MSSYTVDLSRSFDGSLRIRRPAGPAFGGPHTRKTSIKEFHQFDLLTVTIPLDVVCGFEIIYCDNFIRGGAFRRDPSTSVGIRGVAYCFVKRYISLTSTLRRSLVIWRFA